MLEIVVEGDIGFGHVAAWMDGVEGGEDDCGGED